MPFLQPNQQRQSTEGINSVKALLPKLTILSQMSMAKKGGQQCKALRIMGFYGVSRGYLL